MATTRGVKIISDGTVRGTRVYDMETGEPLALVYSVDFSCDPSTGTMRTRIVTGDPFEYEGPAELVTPEEAWPRQTMHLPVNITPDEIAEKAAQRVMEALKAITGQERAALRGMA